MPDDLAVNFRRFDDLSAADRLRVQRVARMAAAAMAAAAVAGRTSKKQQQQEEDCGA